MSALGITLQDLRSTLSRIGLQTQLQAVAEREARNLADQLSYDGERVEAHVVGVGDQVSIELTGPNLWDREFGTFEDEGDASVARALIERGVR